MPNAFTAGVKPGGLNDSTQIRILLCYLIKSAAPLTRPTLEGALLQEELVNWFELGDALADIEKNGLVTAGPNGYTVTDKGITVAEELGPDVPRSVRDTAMRAVLRIQQWKARQASNRAIVEKGADGWHVDCTIEDGEGEVLRLRLAMPDAGTAELVKNRFIARGSEIYGTLLDLFTRPGTADDEPPAGATIK